MSLNQLKILGIIVIIAFLMFTISQQQNQNVSFASNSNTTTMIDDITHDHKTNTNISTLSKYSKEETREIKSLSDLDIKSLKEGTGDAFGGLAILAELNGYPGPRHVLDLADELQLTNGQRENITMLYNRMKTEAIDIGQEIISIESIANEKFDNGTITDEDLRELLLLSAQNYGNLRYVHLSTHLKMMDMLSSEQIDLYNSLRGYSAIHH